MKSDPRAEAAVRLKQSSLRKSVERAEGTRKGKGGRSTEGTQKRRTEKSRKEKVKSAEGVTYGSGGGWAKGGESTERWRDWAGTLKERMVAGGRLKTFRGRKEGRWWYARVDVKEKKEEVRVLVLIRSGQ